MIKLNEILNKKKRYIVNLTYYVNKLSNRREWLLKAELHRHNIDYKYCDGMFQNEKEPSFLLFFNDRYRAKRLGVALANMFYQKTFIVFDTKKNKGKEFFGSKKRLQNDGYCDLASFKGFTVYDKPPKKAYYTKTRVNNKDVYFSYNMD